MRVTMIALGLAFAAGLAAPAARADDSALLPLLTADAAHGWEGVGRLEMGGRSFCTGALIEPALVLTAAHCLFDSDTGARIPDTEITFLAGWRNGAALAYRGVRRAVSDAGYDDALARAGVASAHDLALLELDQPIRSTRVRPFTVLSGAALGHDVAIVSYAHDRADAPSLQEVCGVVGAQDGLAVLSCDVDFGSSGAPVFQLHDGVPAIVSVVSAKADYGGMPVAIGVLLDQPLADLRAALAGATAFQGSAPPSVRVISGGERTDTGAKFVTVGGIPDGG